MDSFAPTSKKNDSMAGDPVLTDALREVLSGPGEERRLSAHRREAVLAQAMESPRSRWALMPFWASRAAAGAAAAVVLAVVALAVLPLGDAPAPSLTVPAGTAVENLRVDSSGGHVVLQWNATESGRHRVIRATDPRALSSAPAELVEGNTWVDPDTNGARLVFYRVEDVL